MTNKEFLVTVADAYGYDTNDQLLFVGKTLLDSALTLKLSNTDIKGGKGAQLQYVYFHTADLMIKITDTQWNLEFIALNAGQSIVTGNDVYYEETITLVGGSGTVTNTPVSAQGLTTVYGWATDITIGSATYGQTQNVAFSTKTFSFSGGTGTQTVCIRYYYLNSASTSVAIPANIIPSEFRLVLECQLVSSDVSTNVIGGVEIIIPKGTATGSVALTLKADGVSSTPLEVRALASTSLAAAACTNVPVYAQINQILNSTNWYDNVVALSIAGGSSISFAHTTTNQLSVWAISNVPSTAPFKCPLSDLTFTSGTVGTCTVGAHTGLLTGVGAGTSLISVDITAKTSISDEATVTCT